MKPLFNVSGSVSSEHAFASEQLSAFVKTGVGICAEIAELLMEFLKFLAKFAAKTKGMTFRIGHGRSLLDFEIPYAVHSPR